jgi:hypothetical protein
MQFGWSGITMDQPHYAGMTELLMFEEFSPANCGKSGEEIIEETI